MELYCLVGGEANSLKRWQEDLSAQFFPVHDKDGKHKLINGIPQYRRLLVAPVQLYKIAFAKEELDNVLPLVCPTPYIENTYGVIKRARNAIARLLGLKKVPAPKYINPFLQPNQVDKAVFVLPIGLKEDTKNGDGEELI